MSEACLQVPERQMLQVGNLFVSYVDWGGKGPPILLLHGITSNAYSWWQVAPALVAEGYHVYSLDLPGHGHSDLPSDHRISTIAGVVCGVIGALQLHHLTLIGHSWGGATTLRLISSNDPARDVIERAILLDPALAMSQEWGAARLPGFLTGIGDNPATTRTTLRESNPSWHDCDVYWKAQALAECRTEAVEGFLIRSGTWNLAPAVSQLELPLLIVLADLQATVVSAERRAELEAKLDDEFVTLLELPGTDHNLYRGGFAATISTLREWLEETRPE